jgi:hypothetical protein
MRFLSIAERELRAGARQKSTHRVRWITGAVFFGLLLWLMWVFHGLRAPQVFTVFSALTLAYCILIATAGTADCLSAEKREGTLGLLFLTNLNGAEIIGGKLCSSALAAVYGLFAIFPLMAVQLLIGGITLQHFGRTVLSLVVAILFSIAAGFFASSLCVRQFTSVALASGLALFFSGGLMAAAAAARALSRVKPWISESLETFSPIYTFMAAGATRPPALNHYWRSVLAVGGMSAVFLVFATLRVTLTWRDRPRAARAWWRFEPPQSWRERGCAAREALRRRLLAINPFFWLGGRRPVSSPVFMVVIVAVVVVTSWVAAPYFGRVMRAGTYTMMVGQLFAWLWGALAIHALVLYYGAMTASQRLAEDKQSGALELVLSTPTTVGSISSGLWMAYGRRMFFPAIVAILAHIFFIWQGLTMAVLDPPTPKLLPGTTPSQFFWAALLNRPIAGVQIEWGFTIALRIVLLALLLLMMVWATLGWVGRWLGLRMKRPGFAPLTSLAIVIAPPIFLFSLACYFADKCHLNRLPDRLFVPMMMWVAVSIAVAHLGTVSVWAGRQLRTNFRAVVTSRFQPAPVRRWWRPTGRRLLRFAIFSVSAATAIVVAVLCFYGYHNWKSRRAWSAFQKQLRQSNESLDLAALLPGRVPTDQNFASTPAFTRWARPGKNDGVMRQLQENLRQFDPSYYPYSAVGAAGIEWTRQGYAALQSYAAQIVPEAEWPASATRAQYAELIIKSLKPSEANLQALAVAARMAWFQTGTNRNPGTVLQMAGPEKDALQRLHLALQIRALAFLALTNANAEAAEDVMTGFDLARLARQIPDTRSVLRTQTMLSRSLQPLWEGMVQRRWTAAQLAGFQDKLSQFNLLADYTNTVHRAVVAHMAVWQENANRKAPRELNGEERLYKEAWFVQPRAWWLENCIDLYRAGEDAIAAVDVAGGHVRIDQSVGDFGGMGLDSETSTLLQQPWWAGASPSLTVFAQTAVNQAIIACALERFRLENGSYPRNLDELIPRYLPSIPNDVVRGHPMFYQTTTNGLFILRSVGPNGIDDRNNPGSDDWLWTFPTNMMPVAPKPKRK